MTRIDHSIANIGIHKYASAYYADAKVHKQLNRLYNGKCAFCESDVRSGSALQIDHYRPKKGVVEDTTHLGYYWLGYEWTNLLPICAKCNRSKSHKFPIKSTGNRQYTHPVHTNGSTNYSRFKIGSAELIDEKPLIVNPEVIDPSNFFVFLPSGIIRGRGQEESDVTIDECKLNRTHLRLARKKLRDDLIKKTTKILADLRSTKINEDSARYAIQDRLIDILEVYTNNGPYSMYCSYLLNHFDYFIAQRFKGRDKRVLLKAYNEFLNAYGRLF